ncbi:cytidine deaminase [Pendulispora albinea]|uniref:Cytidine deaminase n=1 Tax=Pendulispora albinea TaxID=2741071 RepID=A0ABZ2LXF9_9BACT
MSTSASSVVTPALLDRLVAEAKAVRARAYAPYSKYRVGAAIATASGNVFRGCNVENASYGATICAERSAIVQMVASGDDKPVACAIATFGASPGSPCGICRQVLVEFAREMPVVLVSENDAGEETRRDTSLGALLPDAFVSF